MSIQDLGVWAGILGGGGGVLGAIYTALDSLRKKRKLGVDQAGMVASTAISLVESLRKQTETLEEQLTEANSRADDLSAKLRGSLDEAAELRRQHGHMAEALTNAQAEVRVLRLQVKNLSETLDRRPNCPEDGG